MRFWIPRGVQLAGTWLREHAPLAVLCALASVLLLLASACCVHSSPPCGLGPAVPECHRV